ncbi:histidine phosphatase family protein [Enterococcus faecalis]|nr:histidine phosphatase family protein [Enterococcus faecalis]
MDIYWIRHGETELNQKKLFYGTTDASLNQTGIQQSLRLQEKMAQLPQIPVIYTSDLQRTKETASLIFPKRKSLVKPDLNEKSFGAWEGLNAAQIEAKYPEEWALWIQEPFNYTPPEAEAFSKFKRRVLRTMDSLLVSENSFAVVSHLGVIRLILSTWFPERLFWDIELTQGNYTHIQYYEQQFHIKKWNV